MYYARELDRLMAERLWFQGEGRIQCNRHRRGNMSRPFWHVVLGIESPRTNQNLALALLWALANNLKEIIFHPTFMQSGAESSTATATNHPRRRKENGQWVEFSWTVMRIHSALR